MRLHFPNLSRPKKAAKHLANLLTAPLSRCQSSIARACGYRDWHDLELNHSAGAASPLDQSIPRDEFIQRQADLVLIIANCLDVPDGDAQFALAESHLSGDKLATLEDQIAIRLAIWRRTTLPLTKRRERGATGVLKSPGRNGEVVILRSFGNPASVITNQNVGGVADFEYVSPKSPPPLFLPMRLYLPYGYWTEEGGSHVVFSRDYKPMWRLRHGARPERLYPWLWIKWKDQTFLWDDGNTPWANSNMQRKLESFLQKNEIRMLPVLADALPLLVHNDEIKRMSVADEYLRAIRKDDNAATYGEHLHGDQDIRNSV